MTFLHIYLFAQIFVFQNNKFFFVLFCPEPFFSVTIFPVVTQLRYKNEGPQLRDYEESVQSYQL